MYISDKLNNDVQGYIQIGLEGGLRQKKGLIYLVTDKYLEAHRQQLSRQGLKRI